MTDDETECVMKFPELPEPFEIWEQWGQNVDVYTAGQLQQYGKACAKDALRAVERAARAAEREACARQLNALGCDHCAGALRHVARADGDA